MEVIDSVAILIRQGEAMRSRDESMLSGLSTSRTSTESTMLEDVAISKSHA